MKAQDLRLGNFVIAKNEIIKIIEFRESFVLGENDKSIIGDLPSQMKPIELTEDVLVKIGFGKHDEAMNIYAFENERAIVVYVPNRKLLKIECVENDALIDRNIRLNNVEYLHQLQNAYHLLTDQELEINL